MVRPADIVAYTFNAAEYDTDCIVAVVLAYYRDRFRDRNFFPLVDNDPEAQLDTIATWLGIDRRDERSYDSGDFPKVIFGSDELYHEPDDGDPLGPDGEPVAKPRRCAHCHAALEPGYEEPRLAWQVTITIEVDSDAAHTAHDAALAAWDGLVLDGPPVVTVRRDGDDPSNAETIDLAEKP